MRCTPLISVSADLGWIDEKKLLIKVSKFHQGPVYFEDTKCNFRREMTAISKDFSLTFFSSVIFLYLHFPHPRATAELIK